MSKIFSETIVDGIRDKLDKEGIKNLETNELLILISAHFNDEITEISAHFNNEITDLKKKTRKVGWFIFGAIVSVTISLTTGLVIALMKISH